ncbi:NAD(P)/FAD-dependent oxidoreductase [Rhodococcus sp. ARC_M6]|uniref:flavin-containing monooxygenase n=1 Tax=Rhodococcus sp. ARC_M6 TaxID=2928852 RepID=UPI001FB25064|nr:NAD(P)/FAD-dependent oxidoreductase [Rhodococcus sp. ARC_M6]MCJ0902108.1 NAD(P)/FAD-dependent oxidoreductase [Rhodococcus sp. ARC_M6]
MPTQDLRIAEATPTGEGQGERVVDVLILGGGLCGISAAIGCLRKGIDDIVIVERAHSVGGTWHHNTYPGCAVDIPSHVYSFSFELNPDWSAGFSPQGEVESYLNRVCEKYQLAQKFELGTEVLDATWHDSLQRWQITTNQVVYQARSFITAAGPLHEPIIPSLPGLEDFAGEVFHSSNWPKDFDPTGKNVVVIGTGASAIQFVPAIQPAVKQMTVLQRTPSWVMAKPNWKTTAFERRMLRRFPALMQAMRLGIWIPMDIFFVLATKFPRFARAMSTVAKAHIRKSITDPQMISDLTPNYAPACKRLGFSNDFYPALASDNVDLWTSPAARITENSVITADGREAVADAIVLGTGFHTLQNHPVAERIHGKDGRSLADVWDGNPTAYMGTTMAGFPNAYIMFGPNAGTLSGFVMAEAQTDYILGALESLRSHGLTSIEVREEEQQAFVEAVDKTMKSSTFALGRCASYYLADNGRVALPWPGSMSNLRRKLARFDLSAYQTRAVRHVTV